MAYRLDYRDRLRFGMIEPDEEGPSHWQERYLKLRRALRRIENIGAERPEEDTSQEMFQVANDALFEDDRYDAPPYEMPDNSDLPF